MSDTINEMRERLRSSLDPVSAFYLVDTPAAIDRMLAKVASLTSFGVTPEQLAAIRTATVEWLRLRSLPASVPRRMKLEFRTEGQSETGFVEWADVQGQGVEVQIVLPGLVASTAPAFLVDGFWCAFMPPSFYD